MWKFLVIGLCLYFAAFGIQYVLRARRARASRSWPAVDGRIVTSRVVKEAVGTYDSRAIVRVPKVEFEYTVRGRTLKGDTITFGKDRMYTSWPKRADERCSQYPEGAPVRVWFDPARPEVACLERAVGPIALAYVFGIALGLAMLGTAGFVLIRF